MGGGWEARLPGAGSQAAGRLGCRAPGCTSKQEGLPPELWPPGPESPRSRAADRVEGKEASGHRRAPESPRLLRHAPVSAPGLPAHPDVPFAAAAMKAGSGDQGSPPCFLRFPRPVRVVSGAEVELKCVVLGEPPPTVLWEKGGQQLVASERLSFPEDGAEHSLLLSGALPTDAGVYVCRARNTAGEAYAAAAVTVLELPAPEPEPQSSEQSLPPPGTGESAPVFLTGPQSQWVLRGAEVVLTCQVGGLPEPKLYWEKDGMALDEVWDSSHFALEPSPSEDGRGASLTLRIKAVRLPDSGVYVCHARNAHGHAQAGALLQVHQPHESPPQDPDDPPVPVVEPLKCAPKTFWVNEGKHAKFRCYVMGKPEPEIEWHWEGRPLLPDRRHLMYRDRDGGFVLKVLYCQAKDRGLYVCAARNSAGQTLSMVQLHVKGRALCLQCPQRSFMFLSTSVSWEISNSHFLPASHPQGCGFRRLQYTCEMLSKLPRQMLKTTKTTKFRNR